MKVVCIQENIDDKLAQEVGLGERQPRYYNLTQSKEYVVLGLSYFPDADIYAKNPVIEIKNDTGGMTSAPLFLFKVIDDTSSKYWHIKFNKEEDVLRIWPESFYKDFYHDDLSEGVPEIERDFIEVCKMIEEEL